MGANSSREIFATIGLGIACLPVYYLQILEYTES
jgi:hypothetical protein